jgi:hypothetical protein
MMSIRTICFFLTGFLKEDTGKQVVLLRKS